MTCPECGSSEIRVSRSTQWSDVFHRVLGREAFRCRKCRHRFFASDSPESNPERAVQSKQTHGPTKLMSTRAKNRLVRRVIVILIFAVAFVIFWYFLRYLTREPSPPGDSGATSSLSTMSPVQPA